MGFVRHSARFQRNAHVRNRKCCVTLKATSYEVDLHRTLHSVDTGTSEMRETIRTTLGEVVRRFRSDARLSQEELAERAGLSPRTVSNIETGAAPTPRAITLSLLAEALGLDVGGKARLFDVMQPRKSTLAETGGRSLAEALEPFARRVSFDAGQLLFERGAPGHTMYLILSGSVHLTESGVILGAGSFVGEIAMFSPEAKRTQTVAATSDVCVLELCRDNMPPLHRKYPEFSVQLLRLVTSRLLEHTVRLPAPSTEFGTQQSPAA
jgi:transcriptional regulator with XRE-family HTH domain